MGTGLTYITAMDIREERTMTLQPRAKRVELDISGTEYVRILGGPPESVTMRSGYVVLLPSQSVGRHSTGACEEMIVVLQGEGEMLFEDGSAMELRQHVVVYCPPETEHDVSNTGETPLRYIYMVARAHWREAGGAEKG
jgi:mannose-6-phosphate isomerase-like protein (cupin superfamily)